MAAADTTKQYGPFDEGPLSVEERFAEKGRARQDKIWKLYVQQEFVTSPLFDSNGVSGQDMSGTQVSFNVTTFRNESFQSIFHLTNPGMNNGMTIGI